MAVALLQFLQLGDKIFTNLMRILYQVLLLEDHSNGIDTDGRGIAKMYVKRSETM